MEQELICGNRRADGAGEAAAAVRAARGLVLLQDPQVTYFLASCFLKLFFSCVRDCGGGAPPAAKPMTCLVSNEIKPLLAPSASYQLTSQH